VAFAVAVTVAGPGRFLLAGLPGRVVIVSRRPAVPVPGRRAVVVVVAFMLRGAVAVVSMPVPRQSGRHGVPVADGTAAGRSMTLLTGLSGREVMSVSHSTAL
jgi:hypothetical protein